MPRNSSGLKVGSYEHDTEGGNTIPAEHPGPIAHFKRRLSVEAGTQQWSERTALGYRVVSSPAGQIGGALKIYVSNASLPLPPLNPLDVSDRVCHSRLQAGIRRSW